MGEELLFMVALVGGSALMPIVSRRFGLPSAIAEIIFGMVIFNTLIIHKPEWFHLIKELGLIYLMFIAGMELDIRSMVRQKNVYLYLLILMLSFLIVPYTFHLLGYPVYLGIVVSLISGGVIIPVLKETNLMKTTLGADTINFTLSGELLSILMLTALDIHHRYGYSSDMAISVTKIVGILIVAIIFLKALYLLAWWFPGKVESIMESKDPIEEGIRAVIFVAFVGALMAYWAGVEPILGSFMAGTIFSYVFKHKGKFEEKVNAIGFGFFIPLFFICVGGDFDIKILASPDSIFFALFLALMVYLSNAPVLLFGMSKGKTLKEMFAISFLLSSPLSIMIVAATLGIKSGMMDAAYFPPVVLASIISSLIYPSAFKPLARSMIRDEQGDLEQ